jgi:alkanesulfonate monooxygenase SsuD/methylene tetrahydromethanopterin reductase-like flavin-dependent oxidoreductase (luciferase family)
MFQSEIDRDFRRLRAALAVAVFVERDHAKAEAIRQQIRQLATVVPETGGLSCTEKEESRMAGRGSRAIVRSGPVWSEEGEGD